MITHGNQTFESKAEFEHFKRKYPLKYKHPSLWGVMPEFYHCRRDGSDAVFIDAQLSRLSDENRKIIASDYREFYLLDGRDSANKWLVEQVGEFGVTKPEYQEARQQCKTTKRFLEKIEELKKMKKRTRSKFSHIFSD